MRFLKPLKNNALLANTLGNVMEWYDFTLYGILAVIIAQVYFPPQNPTASLLLTFCIFAVGFFMRPLGGIVYGHIGDKFGRKKALISSIILMTLSTVLLGILPGYETIGFVASILVTIVRLFQGLAVGGEFTGSMSYLVEAAPDKQRGLFGSYALVGVLGGILLGTGVISLVSALLPSAEFLRFGWRIPFIFSGVVGIIVLILRKHLKEPKIFAEIEKKRGLAKLPCIEALTLYKKNLAQGFGIIIFNSYAFYILMVYMVTYFHNTLKMDISKATAMNLYMVTLTLLVVPIAGASSDYFGRRKVMGLSAILFIMLAYPLNLFFTYERHLIDIYIAQTLICILLAMYVGPMSTALAELMPTKIRYTGVSMAYNTALAIFGGTSPLLCTYIIEKLHIVTAPGILLTVSAIVSLFTMFTFKETAHKPLQ